MNRQNRHRRSAAVLALLMALCILLAGCSSGGGSSSGTGSQTGANSGTTSGEDGSSAVVSTPQETSEDDPFAETVQLSLGFWQCNNLGHDELWDSLMEKFNIDFEFIQMEFNEYPEKVRLLAASDSIPNICVCPGRTDYFQFVNEGLLRPLPEDLSAYPALEAYLNSPSLDYYKVDGALYGIPRANSRDLTNTYVGESYMIRKDWMKAAGYDEMPDNWDDFFQMVRDIMDLNPDNIPNLLGIVGTPGDMLDPVTTSLSNIPVGFEEIDGEWKPAQFNKEANLGWLELMRKGYQMGIIDKDFAVDTDANVTHGKVTSGQAVCGYTLCTAYDMVTLCNQFEEATGKDAKECLAFYAVPNGADGKPHAVNRGVGIDTIFSADTTDEQMDRALRFIDWMLTDEGQYTLNLGIEGKDYELDADGNYVNLLPEDPETGLQYTLEQMYPSCNVRQLATWGNDWQKINPAVDKYYRDMYNQMEKNILDNAVITDYNYQVAWTNTDAMSKWNYEEDFRQGYIKIIVGTDDIGTMYDAVIADTLAKGGTQALEELNEALAEK